MTRALMLLVVIMSFAGTAAAQQPAPAESTTVAAGTRYGAGGLHEFFFGKHYRDLWTTPVRVELLDLRRVAGGLTPTTAGGRLQSRSLRFRAADGRQFSFRLVDKNPVGVLPEDLRETFAADILQDQTSAGHPASPLIVSTLLDAVGILHPEQRFVVLRDEPALGAFRDEFVGKLGTFEERILPPAPGQRGIGGAVRIADSDTLFALLARDPRERVDARKLLTARLMDLFVGDPDRHRLQWGWAKSGPAPSDPWLPIPEDRDQALIRYDGLFLALTRTYYPEVLNFGEKYGPLIGTTRAGSELDRKLLSGLQLATWDSVAAEIQAKVSDAIIEKAVAQMPREYWAADSARLAQTLKNRRNQLPRVARDFYEFLAREADVHSSDAPEDIQIQRLDDGGIRLRVGERDGVAPLLDRRYFPAETRDLRVYTHGGNDRITVTGDGPRKIMLRVIGGSGDDQLVDSVGGTRFYDDSGSNQALGRTNRIDRRAWIPPVDPSGPMPSPRDFGAEWRGAPWIVYSSDYGVFLGAGASHYDFGFRKMPYASLVNLKGGYATKARAFRLDLNVDMRPENSRAHTTLLAWASQLDIIRFHGFGNEVAAPLPETFYKVEQERLTVHFATAFPIGRKLDAGIGPVMRYARTKLQPGGIITLTRPYGAEGFGDREGFGELGGRAWVHFNATDRPVAASRGVQFNLEGNVFPEAWDVRSTFGEIHGELSTFLTARMPLTPTLALRAGGKKIWGTYPFHEAAFLGGDGTVRGLPLQRYAGDAAVFGNAELRFFVAKVPLIIPADFGFFGLADIGRVYLSGETSNRWHTGVGGGIWLAYLGRGNTVSLAAARSEGRTGLYFGMGFGF